MSDAVTFNQPRKHGRLGSVQGRRKLAFVICALALIVALPFIHSVGASGGLIHETAEGAGIVLIGIAILGRSWCALYIGGRKKREIVATGPYSISRNPLYVFSVIAVLGVGLQTGSVVLAVLMMSIALLIFYLVVRREEEALARHFGPEYEAYRARVPRFGPNFALWRDMETLVVQPLRLRRTFIEALLFLLALPICEAIEALQDAGYFTAHIYLP